MPDSQLYVPLLHEAEYKKIQAKWPENFSKSHAQWSQVRADQNNELRKSGVNVIPVSIPFSEVEIYVRMLCISTIGDLELERIADDIGFRKNLP